MAIDQCHEQMNEVIKGSGGAVGLTENPQALERWMVAGPEISRLVLEFENSFQNSISQISTRHHEQNHAFQTTFSQDVKSLVATIQATGNPFVEDSGELLTLDTKIIMSKEVIKTIYTVEEIGQTQYRNFLKERLTATTNTPLSVIISKNKLNLFSTVSVKQHSKTQQQITDLKKSNTTFARMYISVHKREGDLDNFFQHENQEHPPSLSHMGQLRQGKKSDLLDCLEKCVPSIQDYPQVDVQVFDGPVIIHMLKPGGSRTFEDYAKNIFLPFITLRLKKVKRVDIVWDTYISDSLKQSTRERRMHSGKVQRLRVLPHSPIPSNWDGFLQVEENKNELFHFLSETIQTYYTGEKILISTYDKTIVTARKDAIKDLSFLEPCSHEEADTRILLHVAHCARQGYKHIAIRTVDTDVVVLAVGLFQALNIEELWINFGVGKNYCHIAAHAIANYLNEKAKALIMFHALTGCDTVSSFHGRGKKSAWLAWMAYPEVTNAFISLLSQPAEICPDILKQIERFVVIIYSKTCTLNTVNEARKELFTHQGRNIDNLPPTQAALLQHLKRAVLQAGHVWSQALNPSPELPSPKYWGWKWTSSGWTPVWTDLPDASKACSELVHCGCRKGCKHQCKCKAMNLQCTDLCFCKGGCTEGIDE